MAFSESVKGRVREKADGRCCICGGAFVDVHHIVPESEEGPDSEDNAAPLCAGCHALYGNNPDYRKQVREMRDRWYARCAEGRVSLKELTLVLDNARALAKEIGRHDPASLRSENVS